jgi:hypothetical protein
LHTSKLGLCMLITQLLVSYRKLSPCNMHYYWRLCMLFKANERWWLCICHLRRPHARQPPDAWKHQSASYDARVRHHAARVQGCMCVRAYLRSHTYVRACISPLAYLCGGVQMNYCDGVSHMAWCILVRTFKKLTTLRLARYVTIFNLLNCLPSRSARALAVEREHLQLSESTCS